MYSKCDKRLTAISNKDECHRARDKMVSEKKKFEKLALDKIKEKKETLMMEVA